MSRSRVLMVLISVALTLGFQNCGGPFYIDTSDSLEASSVMKYEKIGKANATPYFGFYSTAFGKDYINEVKGLSNLVHIDSPHGSVAFITGALKNAKRNNLKAVVSVSNVFYRCIEWICKPRPQDEAFLRWTQLKNEIIKSNLKDSIFSFYIDEPEMYGRIREAEAAKDGQAITVDVIMELEFISGKIKADFPEAKLQMTSAAFDVRENMRLPKGFDIFGMDCYNGWDQCGSEQYSKSIPEFYSILTASVEQLEKLDGRKRYLAIFPPTFYVEKSESWGFPSKQLALELFDKYVDFAKRNPRVIAALSFLWPGHYENGATLYGARQFPEMLEKIRHYQKIGAIPDPKKKTCDPNLKPIDLESVACPQGYSGNIERTRNVNCSGVIWLVGEWTNDKSKCKIITSPPVKPPGSIPTTPPPSVGASPPAPVVSVPGPREPVITQFGTGCDDNLCLWIVTSQLENNFLISIRDPANFGIEERVSVQHSLLIRTLPNGQNGISFRVPSNYWLAAYRNRGLDVIVTNKLNNKEAKWLQRFPKPLLDK